jgi:threonine/homoserine/homoserine lactone efflux protein
VNNAFLTEFGTVALLQIFALVSPGPDFAVVVRQSIHGGRRAAIFTSMGITTGIFFHMGYALFGLGWLLSRYPFLLEGMRYAGAACLAFLGVKSLRAGILAARASGSVPLRFNTSTTEEENLCLDVSAQSDRGKTRFFSAFFLGFYVNLSNPKAVLFFISVFTSIVVPGAPLSHKIIYSLWVIITTAIWFICVSRLFSKEKIRAAFLRRVHWFDCGIGLLLLFLAGSLLFSVLRPSV